MRTLLIGLAVLPALCLMAPAGRANIIQQYSRSALSGQTIDWSSFGGPGTMISTPLSEPEGTETATVGSSSGTAELRREGTDFTGNFAVGDALLSLPDGDKSDAFDLHFTGTPVFGVGAQIEPVSGYSGAFTGIMKLYGVGSVLLGEVSVAGDATAAEDDSAVFLGASSSIPISYVTFFVSEGNPFFPLEGDLAINQLSLQEAIPEAPALLLLAPSLLLLAALRQRARLTSISTVS